MFTSSNVVDFTLSSDGRTAFVVDYDAGLHIFDITNPLNPSLESVYNPSGTTQAITLSADGKTAFLSEDFEGFISLMFPIPRILLSLESLMPLMSQ